MTCLTHACSHPWQGLRDGLAGWRTAFPDIRHRVDYLVAEGDLVVARRGGA